MTQRASMVLEANMKHAIIGGFYVCGHPASKMPSLSSFQTTHNFQNDCRGLKSRAEYSYAQTHTANGDIHA
jgi:hypothetical protein